MNWQVGLQTVYTRRDDLLPQTIQSVKNAGFTIDRLFVDGSDDIRGYEREFDIITTVRNPLIRTYGNWVLALAELYIRDYNADLFMMVQDDVCMCRGLRTYLEKTIKLHEKMYYNLYTFPMNQELCPPNHLGWYASNQLGKGALALVFTRSGVVDLLSNQHSIARVQSTIRGWKAVDGGVVTALGNCGYKEMVHNPSLTWHTGATSSMGNCPQPQAVSFRGESFDAMSLLERR